jgi:ABC-type multidrug transport system fused ATPase/permease subunit
MLGWVSTSGIGRVLVDQDHGKVAQRGTHEQLMRSGGP